MTLHWKGKSRNLVALETNRRVLMTDLITFGAIQNE